ncbi:MAG TPA: hypothetical protein VI299_23345 [Polyangiales bacterium]
MADLTADGLLEIDVTSGNGIAIPSDDDVAIATAEDAISTAVDRHVLKTEVPVVSIYAGVDARIETNAPTAANIAELLLGQLSFSRGA